MTEPRKKPGVAFWGAVAIGLATLYVVGFGPACWISSRTGVGADAVTVVYGPIAMLMRPNTSSSVTVTLRTYHPAAAGLVADYATHFAAENWGWRFVVREPARGSAASGDVDGSWEWTATPFSTLLIDP